MHSPLHFPRRKASSPKVSTRCPKWPECIAFSHGWLRRSNVFFPIRNLAQISRLSLKCQEERKGRWRSLPRTLSYRIISCREVRRCVPLPWSLSTVSTVTLPTSAGWEAMFRSNIAPMRSSSSADFNAALTACLCTRCGVAMKMSSFGEHCRSDRTSAAATLASPLTWTSYPSCSGWREVVRSRIIASDIGRGIGMGSTTCGTILCSVVSSRGDWSRPWGCRSMTSPSARRNVLTSMRTKSVSPSITKDFRRVATCRAWTFWGLNARE